MYEVEQLGQAISMGSMVFWVFKPTSRSVNGSETMATPEPWDELVESDAAAMAAP